MRRIAALVLVAMLVSPGAGASQQGVIVNKNWHAMDKCAHDAQAAFPDYTPEANAKREAKLKDCLAGKNLPPRVPQ